jgi:hypothetical protein
LAGRALLRNTVATSHPRPLGVSSPKLPRFRPARLPYCPVQAILRWVLITPTRKDPSAVTAASGSKAGAQQIEVRARCSDCAACDGKRELISSPWGSERVLSARFWSQHASQRGPPQHDTADQTSGMCEKERTLLCPCPCRAPIPIAADRCRRLPDSRQFEENSNRARLRTRGKMPAKSGPLITARPDSREPSVQNWDPPGFPAPGACYSCNTLSKRIGAAGDTSAFSLCRGFG